MELFRIKQFSICFRKCLLNNYSYNMKIYIVYKLIDFFNAFYKKINLKLFV